MKPTRPTTLLAILALLLTGLLAGCGGSDLSGLSAKQLLDKTTAAVKGEKYVSISGKLDQGGSGTGLDLHYVGQDSYGTLTLGAGSLKFERVSGKTWIKPDSDFLKAQMGSAANAVIKLIDGKWIVASADNQSFGQLIAVASRSFVDSEVLNPDSGVTKGSTTSVDGKDCIPLKTKSGTLYVDASSALPVQIVGNGSKGTGKAEFSYDKVDAPTAPAADEQVDLSKLAG